MVRHPDCSVFDCSDVQGWFVDFRRSLSSEEFQRWTLFYDELQHISLDNTTIDTVLWAFGNPSLLLLNHCTGSCQVGACLARLLGLSENVKYH